MPFLGFPADAQRGEGAVAREQGAAEVGTGVDEAELVGGVALEGAVVDNDGVAEKQAAKEIVE